jgi:FkbM family methyltransferase
VSDLSVVAAIKRAVAFSNLRALAVWRQAPPIEAVRALYQRLHSGQLRPADVIPLSAAELDNITGCIERMRADVGEFDKALPGFRATYDIFRAFAGDEVVLDVGAHWGYSVAAMRHQGCVSRIISVEAMATNAASLDALKAVEAGRYDWINIAAGSEEGILTVYIPVVNGHAITGLTSTGRTLDDERAKHAVAAISWCPPREEGRHTFKLAVTKVRAARLDTILAEHGGVADKVAAIKMDIEGHEGPALRGAVRLFTEQRPLFMVEDANTNPETVAAMTDYGYFHCARHDGRLSPHPALSLANDGFFVHPSRIEEYRRLGIFEG